MKHKKILAAILALASLTALTPLTAFAAESDPTVIDQDAQTQSGDLTVSYEVAAAYTVTIPAGVTLADAEQTADITAENVLLPEGKKISVKLTAATNTTSGSTFNAKAGESAVTYTIQNGNTPVALGDEVAALDKDTTTSTLTFAKAADAAPTQAGTHTEQLTFTIAVEDAAVAVSGITLNKTSLNLTAGGFTANLTATVQPDDATNKTVTWSSDNEEIATVDQNGKVTAVAPGTATITAKAGGKTATCTVTVTPATKTLTLSGNYFDPGDNQRKSYSCEFEYTDNDTWKDIEERYDNVTLIDYDFAPSGKIICIGNMFELKSAESVYEFELVSINDKVSAYSSYKLESRI